MVSSSRLFCTQLYTCTHSSRATNTLSCRARDFCSNR
jgi:hypothetical protein